MKVVPIFAGMGNQMFMYAFYHVLKQHDKRTFCTECALRGDKAHSGYDLKRAFGISTDSNWLLDGFAKFILKIRRCFPPSVFHFVVSALGIRFVRDTRKYEESFLRKTRRLSFFWGYWMDISWFSSHKEDICRIFRFNQDAVSEATKLFLEDIQSRQGSVAVHIRRGDFVDANMALEDAYYYKAIDVMKKYVLDPIFYVFSDDMEYAKKMNIPNAVYVDCNKGENAWQDMFLISSCRHQIIANSSFSWWGGI